MASRAIVQGPDRLTVDGGEPSRPRPLLDRVALRKRIRREGEEAAARVETEMARDRVAHDALAARDRAAGAVRVAEQALAEARERLDVAERVYDRRFPGSSCACFRCSNERRRSARAS